MCFDSLSKGLFIRESGATQKINARTTENTWPYEAIGRRKPVYNTRQVNTGAIILSTTDRSLLICRLFSLTAALIRAPGLRLVGVSTRARCSLYQPEQIHLRTFPTGENEKHKHHA